MPLKKKQKQCVSLKRKLEKKLDKKIIFYVCISYVVVFQKVFAHSYTISSIPIKYKILSTVLWFQVFQSINNNYMVSSNDFHLIIVICLHTVLSFQVTNNNLKRTIEINILLPYHQHSSPTVWDDIMNRSCYFWDYFLTSSISGRREEE